MKRDVLLVLPSQAGGALQMACRALIAAQQAAHEPSTLLRPLSLSQMCHLLAQLGQKAASTANASRAEANAAPAAWVNGWRGSAANISGLVFTPEMGKILPVLVHHVAAPCVPRKRSIPWCHHNQTKNRDPAMWTGFQPGSSVVFAANAGCSGLD